MAGFNSGLAGSDVPVIPVILAGGAGNWPWPLSRQEYPKQLIPLMGDKSLVQQTALRFAESSRFEPPLVIAAEAIRFAVAEQLRAADVRPAALVLEPVGRGHAARWRLVRCGRLVGALDALGARCRWQCAKRRRRHRAGEQLMVVSERRLTALVGVKDLAVVVTDDAILVSDLDKAQEVKRVVEQLKRAGRSEVVLHKVVHRPWGYDSTRERAFR